MIRLLEYRTKGEDAFRESAMNKHLEKELKRQRKFFDDILSGMKDWVRVIDKNNVVLFMNEPMKKKVGDNVGKQCFLSLGKKEPCQHCITNRAIFEGKAITKEEIVDGRIYSVVSSPIWDENHEIYCAVEVFRDITEKRAMENLIIEQNNKMKKDLNFAKQLQHKILPENRVYNGILKIASKYIPSEILGGDVYDVVEIDDQHIGMYIADVSGHGVTSSMMTMFIRQTLKNLGDKAIDPAITLRYLYHRYRELHIDDQYYITIFYGVYNQSNKTFTYSNAGHNCMPVLVRKDDIKELEASGLPICTLFDDVQYEKVETILQKGDKLFFYTDGISEAYEKNEGFFQNHRVMEICKLYGTLEIEELIEKMINEVMAFSKEQLKDDIAIFVGEILR
ncbi:MAG: SpoIIE family protein phosphatase [Bacillota bacterium]